MTKRGLAAGAAWLAFTACGGLVTSSGRESGADASPTPSPDAGTFDARTTFPNDGTTDRDAALRGEAADGPMGVPICAAMDAGQAGSGPWTAYSLEGDAGYAQYINGIWGSGPSDVWAVGQILGRNAAWHWDGTTWVPARLPSVKWTPYVLNGVWGSGPGDVWAVGFGVSYGTAPDIIVHWNGGAWSVSPLPASAMDGALTAVWGSGADDVWAVGHVVMHWDGTAWSTSSSLMDAGLGETLTGVRGSGPNDVWAVGTHADWSALVLHWNGSAWSTSASSFTTKAGADDAAASFVPASVWGSGPDDVWAAGQACLEHPHSRYSECYPDVWRWDGEAWADVMSPSSKEGYLGAVSGTGPCDVWVVGGGGPGSEYVPTAFHFAGEEGAGGPKWSRRIVAGGYYGGGYFWPAAAVPLWGSSAAGFWTAAGGMVLHH